MLQTTYDTIVLGATFLGAGVALCNPQSTLIIEGTSLVGGEFVDSLNDKPSAPFAPVTPRGQEYAAGLMAAGVMNEQRDIYAVPALFSLCHMLQRHNVPLLCLTEVCAIQRVERGFRLTLFNCDGTFTLHARRVIDTTSLGVGHDSFQQVVAQKYLNALLYNGEGHPRPALPGIVTNSVTNQSILRMPVPPEEDLFGAKTRLYAYANQHAAALGGWKLHYIPSTFAYSMPPTQVTVEEDFLWAPSCAWDHLLQAFDQGGMLS